MRNEVSPASPAAVETAAVPSPASIAGSGSGRSGWLVLAFAGSSFLPFGLAGLSSAGLVAAAAVAVVLGIGLWLYPPRTRLVWGGLALPLLAAPEMLVGTPSAARAMLGAVLGILAIFAIRGLEGRVTIGDRRRWDLVVGVGLSIYVLLTWGAISYRYAHFGDRTISQDTAYFEQCIWGFVNGRNFFMGSSQAWWRYDPPLSSHFAMHVSPVLFPIALAYRIWSSYHLLHLLQVIAITAAAIPVYRLVRDVDPRVAAAVCVAYLINACVLSQTQGAFHELAFAAPAVSFAVYYFVRQRLRPFLVCLVLALLVREDLSLLAGAAGVVGLIVRDGRPRRAAWVILPILIGILGWIGSSLVMSAFGHSGGQVIAGLFSRFGSTYPEILLGMIQRPGDVMNLLLEGHRPVFLLGLIRPGLLGALVSPLSLLIAPALTINLLVRGAGTAWLHVHYSVYLPAALMPAAVAVWMRWSPRVGALLGGTPQAARAAIAVLMLTLSVIGLPDVFGSEMLQAYRLHDDEAEIRTVVAALPPEAAVAAPRFMLHAIARRERLYMVNRWSTYTPYTPDYVVIERDFRRVHLNDGTFVPYAAYAAFLSRAADMEEVLRLPHYLVYRRVGSASAPLAGTRSPRPAELPAAGGRP